MNTPISFFTHMSSGSGLQTGLLSSLLSKKRFAMLLLALFATILSPMHSALAEGSAAAVPVQQVNINTADAGALAAGLKGVGQARAQEIVRHRETFGPFASPDELMEVKGVGKSTLEMNRKVITLE